MQLATVTLNDKYTQQGGVIYVTGTQALVRLALLQRSRDHTAGLNTACLITGYRGSPMHNVDKEIWRVQQLLAASQIQFVPAVNEDLAVTSLWGAQQANLFCDAKYDGVFGLWYGKGPGLDRSMDAMRHANLWGTSRYGGVLAIVGDDHSMASTDVTAVCEPTFTDLMMPVLYPANVQELMAYGLLAIEMSRFCGAWVGVKTLSDTLDTVATVDLSQLSKPVVRPPFEFPPHGVHIRAPDPWHQQEERLVRYKIPAALAFARANQLNELLIKAPRPRFGIVASGIAALGVLDALESLGLDRSACAELGISVLKIAMPHPLDTQALRTFGDGLEEILVVEEKRRIIEHGVKDALYALPDHRRPRISGRYTNDGQRLISELGALSPDEIARAIAKRIAAFHVNDVMRQRIAFINNKAEQREARQALSIVRTPYFCSGCPHNTSTRVPSGSRAHGGVGCHFMATQMHRDNVTHTHMGGEGATWIGQAPFVSTKHVFQNLGDGTYFHSASLAIRACVASGVNITYKILYNDAVAMTGGQPVDGPINPATVTQQVYAEGVRKIVVVTDDLNRYHGCKSSLAPGTQVKHRRMLDCVQRELREYKGVSVLLYDQTCAAEKRRRRRRGEMPEPNQRIFINDRVCEGCGDCSEQSNCLSVVPIDTLFGRKREIDQSSCNKDYSCLEGFCPSFVTVVGAEVRKAGVNLEVPSELARLPDPELPSLDSHPSYNILVTGIGGTGVVTVGALITMAAHLEGKACAAVDQFGMAQKGGAVTSHIRIARRASDIYSVHLNAGTADLVLGCDSLVAAGELALETMSPMRTRAVINTHQTITGQFTRNQDLQFPTASITKRIETAAAENNVDWLDATALATGLMGDSIATNLFMLGYAYQKGLLPVTAQGIERAIELNGTFVQSNIETFRWGRRASHQRCTVESLIQSNRTRDCNQQPLSLNERIEYFSRELTSYQNAAYAKRYRKLVELAMRAQSRCSDGTSAFTDAVSRSGFKLMAYKDEYEVARLYTETSFQSALTNTFSGDFKIRFHLAPPMLSMFHRKMNVVRKREYGPWMLPVMRLLAKMKCLRGTIVDPFALSPERKLERELIRRYEAVIKELADNLNDDNYSLAVRIASIAQRIRGYGHIKQRHLQQATQEQSELLRRWRKGEHDIESHDTTNIRATTNRKQGAMH